MGKSMRESAHRQQYSVTRCNFGEIWGRRPGEISEIFWRVNLRSAAVFRTECVPPDGNGGDLPSMAVGAGGMNLRNKRRMRRQIYYFKFPNKPERLDAA